MDLKLQKIIPQLITVLVVVLVFGFFTYNAQINMENRGIDFGYGFLSQESSFDVQFSLIEYDCLLYTSPSPRDRQKSRMPSSA